MITRQTRWTDKRALVLYFVLACAISWAREAPLVLHAQGVIQSPVPYPMHYLAAYGPLLAALILTGLTDGIAGLRELLGRVLKWRVHPVWWLMAGSPLLLMFFIYLAFQFIPGQIPDVSTLGGLDFLPYVGFGALPLWILTFGIGEETGWRGFLLPRLQKNHSALSATVILWLLWSLWHLPLFFYSYDVSILPGLLVGLLAGSITFTWLYNSTEGSILICAVWHGLFNLTTACTVCKASIMAAIVSTIVMVWAVIVVIVFKPGHLSRREKQVTSHKVRGS